MYAMILLNSKTQILVIVFVNLVFAEKDREETKGQAKNSFVSLLKNIVDVNEKRVEALKKLNNLQDFIMTKNTLAKIHDYDLGDVDSGEDFRDQRAVLTLIDMRSNLNLSLRRTFKKQEAANSNINIFVPFNSFNIKTEYRNDENNRINNRNDDDSTKNHSINDDNDKVNTRYDNINYNINSNSHKTEESNIEKYRMNRKDDSYKAESINKENNDIDYNYYDAVKMFSRNVDGDVINKGNDNNDQNNAMSEEYNDKDNRIGDYSETWYRKNWRGSSCDKSAAKACRKACVNAHKNGCMLYKCSRRAKKAFAKECKRSCKNMFMSGRYSDSEWE